MLADLNRLKVFSHIYRQKSIVAAAKHLHLSQPAVSQQLQKLESELKVQLFTRLHKKLVATDAAHRLFQLVEPFIVQLERELPYLRMPGEKPYGSLRIGAPREFGKEYLPHFCHRFRNMYPDVSFELKFKEALPLLTMMKEGSLDFALVDVYFGQNEMTGFLDLFSNDPLLTERMLLVCSKDYYQEEIRGNHTLENLLDKEFLTDEDDPSILSLWFKHHFNRLPDDLNIIMTMDSHEALISGLKLGMGLGIATAHLIWDELQSGEVVPITTDQETMINWISLVQLQDKVPTLTEKTFRDFLLSEVKKDDIQQRFRSAKQFGEKFRQDFHH